MDLLKKIRYVWHAWWRQPSGITGLFPKFWGVFCLPSGRVWGYVYTKPDTFCAGTKTIADKASVNTSERWFGALSVTEGSCTARISKVKSHISDRCSYDTGELFLSAQKAICLAWSQPKFLSLFVGPFPADRPRISNSAQKIKNFSTEDKKILGKFRAIFRTCMYNQARCVYSEMSSYLGEH